jgi:hypothetical protein
MIFKFWELVCLINILVLSYAIYKIINGTDDSNKQIFGCIDCYAIQLVLSFYISIFAISCYCLIYNDMNVAKGLFLVQIIYKLVLFVLFDTNATNIITRMNLMIIPFLAFSILNDK